MKLEVIIDYSHLLWILCSGPQFSKAVSSMQLVKGPNFDHEGMAGYIETVAVFNIKDLQEFTNLFNSFYSLSHKRKMDIYGLAKGLGDCK